MTTILASDARDRLFASGYSIAPDGYTWIPPVGEAEYLRHHNCVTNLTPHGVTLIAPGSTPGDGWTWPAAEGGVARCSEARTEMPSASFDPWADGGMHCAIPIVRRTFGAVTGLPALDPNKSWRMYIVTQFVADACPEREDLLVPTDLVRDPAGNIIGCRAFAWRPALR